MQLMRRFCNTINISSALSRRICANSARYSFDKCNTVNNANAYKSFIV